MINTQIRFRLFEQALEHARAWGAEIHVVETIVAPGVTVSYEIAVITKARYPAEVFLLCVSKTRVESNRRFYWQAAEVQS